MLTADAGFILALGIAAASVDGRAMLLGKSASAIPNVSGEKKYLCSETMLEELLSEGVEVIVPVRKSMMVPLSPELRSHLNVGHRIMETVNTLLAR